MNNTKLQITSEKYSSVASCYLAMTTGNIFNIISLFPLGSMVVNWFLTQTLILGQSVCSFGNILINNLKNTNKKWFDNIKIKNQFCFTRGRSTTVCWFRAFYFNSQGMGKITRCFRCIWYPKNLTVFITCSYWYINQVSGNSITMTLKIPC